MPLFSSPVSAALLLGLLQPAKRSSANGSVASTRATSPSSSSGDAASSEDASAVPTVHRKQLVKSDVGDLARRRGRSVLMLSELVIDHGSEGMPEGSPSEESTSSLLVTQGHSSTCTPANAQFMGFSPPMSIVGNGYAPASCAVASQVVDQSMMRTVPVQRSIDASQRSQVPSSRTTIAAAGADASQRTPGCAASATGGHTSQHNAARKVSFDAAALGGDASQRSPPGCTNRVAESRSAHFCPVAQAMQQSVIPLGASPPKGFAPTILPPALARPSPPKGLPPALDSPTSPESDFQVLLDLAVASGNQKAIDALRRQAQKAAGIAPPSIIAATVPEVSSPASSHSASSGDASQRSPDGKTTQGIIAGTSPDAVGQGSARVFSVGDASQRCPVGSVLTNFAVDGCSDTVKSWLLGASSNGLPVSDALIAEQLHAAVPEVYED